MSALDQAIQTQLDNIQKKTGKSLSELSEMVTTSGLKKHSEIRTMLQEKLGLSYGDANALSHYALQSDGTRQAVSQELTPAEVLDQIYSGKKAALRPIHERLMAEIQKFGAFEVLPKKGYLSLRRKKQFAMLGPGSNTRLELGLNVKDLPAAERLILQPKGSMCDTIVRLSELEQVDEEVIGWVHMAFERAG